ncbi:unnamed protein product [Enterobius vermicularis]|uniref:NAD(P)-bd_dom domain-containing protein n=1 Tax=Enterobius vermicularis TaxID=51028 RepID=A0A0N4VJF3_ENTVE|nr:unnamed protein product [Enterobius vermicularis]
MPAAEREFVDAINAVDCIDSIKSVLYLSAADSAEDDAFLDAAGASANITVLKRYEEMEAAHHQNHYNIIILNRILISAKVII